MIYKKNHIEKFYLFAVYIQNEKYNYYCNK